MSHSFRIAPTFLWLCTSIAVACGGGGDTTGSGGTGAIDGSAGSSARGGSSGSAGSNTGGAGATGTDSGPDTTAGSGGSGATSGAGGNAGTGTSGAGGSSGSGATGGAAGKGGSGAADASGGAAGGGGNGGSGATDGAAGGGSDAGDASDTDGSDASGGGAGAGSGGAAGSSGAGPTGGTAGAAGTDGGTIDGSFDADDARDVSPPPDVSSDGGDGCVPLTCTPVGGRYCGRIGDGCGNALECGACPGAQVCGARNPKVCGAPCPLCPQIPRCDSGTTSVSGTAVTGALTNPDPLYNALVFIPNLPQGGKRPPITAGPSCNRCTPVLSDDYIAAAVTGPDGKFTLHNVPAGTGIPLVVELGHWRYETTINVLPCVDNALPAGTARLPRAQAEGNIPLTAVATGNVDALECILRKMGVADSEFSNANGTGRIQFYRNNGARYDANTPTQAQLVGTTVGGGEWDHYDQILFPCEGLQSNESANALTNFVGYTSKGGRVLATHYSYTWLYQNAGFATAGTWGTSVTVPADPLISHVDTSSPKGADFATWLQTVGALYAMTPPQVAISDARRDLNDVPAGKGGRRWIWADSQPPTAVMQMSVDTPVNATPDQTCGRVIFSDFHLASATNQNLTFPGQCNNNPLTAQEKILEFMVLDLAAGLGACELPPPPPPSPPDPSF